MMAFNGTPFSARFSPKKVGEQEDVHNQTEGINYSFDFWFLLGSYVHPEDIGKFALLCRTSAAVLNSMAFWIGLYNSYYKVCYEDRLPQALQPANIRRAICLRMNVIRALFYTYPRFRNCTITMIPNINMKPNLLVGRTCVLVWYENKTLPFRSCVCSQQWRYYFKLKIRSSLTRPSKINQDVSDIWKNPEEDCKLLKIVCAHFVPIPSSIENLILTSARLRLTQSFRNYKLELLFQSKGARAIGESKRQTVTAVVLDPIVYFNVLDWWHPKYPHVNIVQTDDDKIEEPLMTWDQ